MKVGKYDVVKVGWRECAVFDGTQQVSPVFDLESSAIAEASSLLEADEQEPADAGHRWVEESGKRYRVPID